MTYTVTKLVTNAYYTSGIVSREFETVQGYQLSAGIEFLNELIADKTVDNNAIPYYSKYEFNGVIGQEEYFVPNLIEVDTLVFFLQTVRFNMMQTGRDLYFGASRANNINSLPFNFHVERQFGGANIFMYFKPDQQYLFQLWGQFRLSAVAENQDLLSNVAKVDLGQVSVNGAGTLAAGVLVINDTDMLGTYATATALATAITAAVDNVTASVYLNAMTLTDTTGGRIHLETSGDGDSANGVTFYNFSTLDGPLDQTFMPMVLDQFYINYLRYSLAARLCAEFNFDTPNNVSTQLKMYEGMIRAKSGPMDLHVKTITMLDNDNNRINYGQVNLGHGFTVG